MPEEEPPLREGVLSNGETFVTRDNLRQAIYERRAVLMRVNKRPAEFVNPAFILRWTPPGGE